MNSLNVMRKMFSLFIALLFAGAGSVPAALVSEWRMDESAWMGVAGEVVDNTSGLAGRARTAGGDNSLPDTIDAQVCRGGYFRGQGFNVPQAPFYVDAQHFVQLPDSNTLSPLAQTGAMSLSGWFLPAATDGTRTLIHKGEGGSTQEYRVAIVNQRLQITIWNANGSPENLTLDQTINNEQWYFFGVTAERGGGNRLNTHIYLYNENGTLLDQNSGSWNPFFGGRGGNYDNKPLTGDLLFGGTRFGNSNPTQFFDGVLDELRLHDSVLSSAEFLTLLAQTRACGSNRPLPVFDDFSAYPAGSIEDEDGGQNWGGPWSGSGGQSITDTSAEPLIFQASNGLSIRSERSLSLTQNNDSIVSRSLNGTFTGDRLFMSMLVQFEGSPGDNDFLGFWVQNPGFGQSPQFGIKVNEGSGGERDFFVRLDTDADYSTEFQPGQTYLLVAEFEKSSSGFFNHGRLWVNPQCTDSPPPTPSAQIAGNPSNQVTGVSELGFRTENLGNGASVLVGQVAAGESWADVVQCTCFQNGLEATYYNNYNRQDPFPANPDLTRLDARIDFDWVNGSPDPIIDNNNFAVQWQGTIEVPEDGAYRFRARTDDGVRLWVGDLDRPVTDADINDWSDRSAADSITEDIVLQAGRRYGIRMQFYENGGQASASLFWERPGQSGFEVVPEQNLFACLPVAAPLLESATGVCGTSDLVSVTFAQTSGSRPLNPISAGNPGFYSVENVTTGDVIQVSGATPESSGYSVLLELNQDLENDQTYRVTAIDVQDTGGVVMAPNPASVEFAAGATGLNTSYWNNRNLNGPSVLQQNTGQINNDWGNGSPVPGTINNDLFSVRWSGFIVPPVSGAYQFRTRTDDGVRLWVNNLSAPIIDEWRDYAPTNHTSAVINLQEGQVYAFRMEMYENQGGAVAQLLWDTPEPGGFNIIPTSAFFSCPEVPSTLDHFRISSGGSAVTCSPTPVTIQASDVNGAPVADYTGNISFSTSTGLGDWLDAGGTSGVLSRGAGNSGDATYSFAEADNGVITLNLSHTTAATVNTNVTDGNVRELAGFDPDILFSETGFIFHQAGDLSSLIGNQVAGKSSAIDPGTQSLQLSAVQTNDETGACEAFLDGPRAVEVGYVCDNPASCASANALNINGTPVASNDAGGNANTSSLNFDFGDASSSTAPFELTYNDAGRISLFARLLLEDADGAATGGLIAGSSNNFVSVPAGFCIQTVADEGECPGDPSQCSVLTSAGSEFDVTYQAVGWRSDGETGSQFCQGNDATPGFERNSMLVTHGLVEPIGGEPGVLEPDRVSFGNGGDGEALQAQRISEVGAFKLQIPAGQPYLGTVLPGAESATIGRLVPASFDVSLSDAGELAPFCSNPAPGFLYTGQTTDWRIEPSVTITALNVQGATTTNYTRGTFQKLVAGDVARTIPASDSQQPGAGPADLLALTFTDQPAGLESFTGNPGIMIYRFSADDQLVYPKTEASLVGPFGPTLTFGITDVEDSDGVGVSSGIPLNFSPVSLFELRYGRWLLENVYGPETADELFMPFRTEYWDGSRFVLNAGDNCSPWATSDINNTAENHSLTTAMGEMNGGNGGPLRLVPNGTSGKDTLSWNVPVWLQSDWNSEAPFALENPSATATFGVFRGHDRVIYWREK